MYIYIFMNRVFVGINLAQNIKCISYTRRGRDKPGLLPAVVYIAGWFTMVYDFVGTIRSLRN